MPTLSNHPLNMGCHARGRGRGVLMYTNDREVLMRPEYHESFSIFCDITACLVQAKKHYFFGFDQSQI